MFQFYNLIPSLTARENVALITDIAADSMTPEAALDLVGLSHRLDHFPSQLSGGKRPRVLLCDEPTGALDAKTGVIVLEALEHANRELGTATAIITHNAVIASMGDRVVSLSGGEIANVKANPDRRPACDLAW